MDDSAPTPQLALEQLGDLSTDVRAAALLAPDGSIAAHTGPPAQDAAQLRELLHDLWREAEAAAGGEAVPQLEVSVAGGAVFAVRDRGWTIAAVARRAALPSLMFYDLRSILARLPARAA